MKDAKIYGLTRATPHEAWIKQTGQASQNLPIFSKDGITTGRQYMLTIASNGKFRAHVGTSLLYYFDGTNSVQLNTWYQVAMTYDGANLRLYVNGVPDGSVAVSGNILTTTQPLRIGGSTSGSWGNYKFQGLIDEATVYSRALSPVEISRIYCAGYNGKCKGDTYIDSDTDYLPDWWERKHFGDLTQAAEMDYDQDGANNLTEYSDGSDPNSIVFYLTFPNLRTSSDRATGEITVVGGVPYLMSFGMDTKPSTWVPYDPTVLATLGTGDTQRLAWVGLKGRADNSGQYWLGVRLTRDTTPPVITITNPALTTLSCPLLQLQGYTSESIQTLRYDIANDGGTLLDQEGFVTRKWYDTNSSDFTTNWFQCYDIEMVPGLNTITLQAEILISSAEDYIRFKPGRSDGDGNIYVTLGVVQWNAHGLYSRLSGFSVNSTPAATGPTDYYEFPWWTTVIEDTQ